MIDPKEIRIGNLVKIPDFDEPQQVAAVFREDLGFDIPLDEASTFFDRIRAEAIDPIPITPEWLERVGWDHYQRMSGHWVCEKRHPQFTLTWYVHDETIFFVARGAGWDMNIPHIKHIHQLQNFVFDLTGSELTVKETTETK